MFTPQGKFHQSLYYYINILFYYFLNITIDDDIFLSQTESSIPLSLENLFVRAVTVI